MTPLIRVLLGLQPPSKRVPVTNISFFDEKLNPSQKAAIRFCLESPEVACIHGPPGMSSKFSDCAPNIPCIQGQERRTPSLS